MINYVPKMLLMLLKERSVILKKIFGIKIIRIGTENGSEFINSHRNNQKITVKETNFTQFLIDKNILHQITPIRSPQSNGKIERFNQNYTKLFVFDEKILQLVYKIN